MRTYKIELRTDLQSKEEDERIQQLVLFAARLLLRVAGEKRKLSGNKRLERQSITVTVTPFFEAQQVLHNDSVEPEQVGETNA